MNPAEQQGNVQRQANKDQAAHRTEESNADVGGPQDYERRADQADKQINANKVAQGHKEDIARVQRDAMKK